MITGPIIAEIAALVGDPARATMMSALLDGRALTASELALAARITPQTASTHLAKLTEAGLLSVARSGRHRYFRLASPRVAEMIDGIVAVALEKRPRYRPLSDQARALSAARICYDHLAGRLSVDLIDSSSPVTTSCSTTKPPKSRRTGSRFFTQFGIELPTRVRPAATSAGSASIGPSDAHTSRVRSGPRSPQRYFDLGWMERMKHSHAVIVTAVGTAGLPGDLRHRRRAGVRRRFARHRSVHSPRPTVRGTSRP